MNIITLLNKHILSGGLDTKIRIYSLVQGNSEIELLSTLSLHNGAVLCVRFSHDGKYLASGSDGDNVVILWELDE